MCICVVVVVRSQSICVGVDVDVGVSGNNIGEEGAKALGPHLAKLVNITVLWLNGKGRGWDVYCGGAC